VVRERRRQDGRAGSEVGRRTRNGNRRMSIRCRGGSVSSGSEYGRVTGVRWEVGRTDSLESRRVIVVWGRGDREQQGVRNIRGGSLGVGLSERWVRAQGRGNGP